MGNDTLRFSYDAMGSPMTVTWNGAVYTYVTNLQGNVRLPKDKKGLLYNKASFLGGLFYGQGNRKNKIVARATFFAKALPFFSGMCYNQP